MALLFELFDMKKFDYDVYYRDTHRRSDVLIAQGERFTQRNISIIVSRIEK